MQARTQDRGTVNRDNGEYPMNYEQPQYEIETSVMALGITFAASLISLIVWIV